jgi:hypothetical protein
MIAERCAPLRSALHFQRRQNTHICFSSLRSGFASRTSGGAGAVGLLGQILLGQVGTEYLENANQ